MNFEISKITLPLKDAVGTDADRSHCVVFELLPHSITILFLLRLYLYHRCTMKIPIVGWRTSRFQALDDESQSPLGNEKPRHSLDCLFCAKTKRHDQDQEDALLLRRNEIENQTRIANAGSHNAPEADAQDPAISQVIHALPLQADHDIQSKSDLKRRESLQAMLSVSVSNDSSDRDSETDLHSSTRANTGAPTVHMSSSWIQKKKRPLVDCEDMDTDINADMDIEGTVSTHDSSQNTNTNININTNTNTDAQDKVEHQDSRISLPCYTPVPDNIETVSDGDIHLHLLLQVQDNNSTSKRTLSQLAVVNKAVTFTIHTTRS